MSRDAVVHAGTPAGCHNGTKHDMGRAIRPTTGKRNMASVDTIRPRRMTQETPVAAKFSAGLLVHRGGERALEVFLVHPGGPYWKNKDAGAWSIPKGEYAQGEDALDAARREFLEETGIALEGVFTAIPPARQAGGKIISAWCVPGDFDAKTIRSNCFSMEWPPRSGRMKSFPEVDRGGWFSLDEAMTKVIAGQRPLIEALKKGLADSPG